jgi:hypothetical protein
LAHANEASRLEIAFDFRGRVFVMIIGLMAGIAI